MSSGSSSSSPSLTATKQRLFERILGRILNRAVRRGKITAGDRETILREARTRDFQSFMEYFMENWPEILEMFMAFMEMFMMFA